MLDQLFELIKNNSQEAIVNNPEVPNEMNEPAMEVASNSILESLRGFSESDIQQIQTDVNNNNIDMNSQQMGFLGGNMTDGLMKKLGLNSGAAKTIGAILLPLILKQLFGGKSNTGAAAPASSGFNIQDILGGILGGGNAGGNNPLGNANAQGGGGIMDKVSDIGKSLGLDKNGDGKVDLSDLGGFLK